MNETIVSINQQIIKTAKVDGKGWMVFAKMKSRMFPGTFEQGFRFFAKKDAVEFCLSCK